MRIVRQGDPGFRAKHGIQEGDGSPRLPFFLSPR